MSMILELRNVTMTAGDELKIKGEILDDAERFQIDLGCDNDDLALHFNPRFDDDTDGHVLVFNSKTAGFWDEERRETDSPLQRGTDVKIVLRHSGDVFEVLLADGQEVQFPNRVGMDVISYISIRGDFRLTSFKIC
ncbi:galectin-2-like [Gouania willdenowi]|uniref:Galectin n=1 Tax=Gouania willdenowi TaxID=441366 RepID=A0A8C5D290_GOUWI|nr:galectin-2 [Gouania willdenowi]XP_028311927.1 galectin-2 [Gouania willdenowi]XP_028311928.1 galectin-2 [Gouania willdenowi]